MFFNSERALSLLLAFNIAGLTLNDLELRQFLRLDRLLLNNLERLDLTRTAPERLIVKHYLDSALVADFMPDEEGIILDLGAGAGFPGLPLAIRRPHWSLLLAEPRLKRLTFIEEAIFLLALEGVKIYPHKVGDNFNQPIKAIVARDFGQVGTILDLAAKILPKDGRVYLLKGANPEPEMALAKSGEASRHFTPLAVKYYQVGPYKRSFLTYQKKTAPSTPKLTPSSTEIASPHNPRYRSWLKLLEGHKQRRAGETIAMGKKIVRELLTCQVDLILGVIVTHPRDLEGFPLKNQTPVFFVRPEIFGDLDVLGAGPPLLWLKTPPLPPFDPTQTFAEPWLLTPFQDPQNVGAVIRAAAALGSPVVTLAEAASPYHFKALRVAGPAVFQTPLFSGPSFTVLPDLPRDDLYALSPRGQDIYQADLPAGVGLVLGREGPGLDGLWPEAKRLAIPMRPRVESLNGALAAAVALALLKAKNR
ncbi:MAG: class I SAM-dependent methyltransferase [Deltaproteobacteria bacterium]|jgi:16S rRNA (guanine527-N7)-methyltransferase|nr:class I SAM-dependent methyltransferase [Deltaproteobacteria bacterium]